MGQNQGKRCGCDAFDTGSLAQGRGPDGFQLLPHFIGQAHHSAIIQAGGQGTALILPEGDDVGILAIQITGILGVYFDLFDNLGAHPGQVGPDAGEGGEIHLRQGQQIEGGTADSILADGKPELGGLIGGQAAAGHCFT